jgi:transmembrane sensor
MTPEELLRLQEKFLAGTCSAEEMEQLMRYEDDFQLLEEAFWKPELGEEQQIKHQLLNKLHEAMDKPEKAKFHFNFYYAAAAIFVFAMFTLVFYPKQTDHIPRLSKVKSNHPKNIIIPGSNKATLTLSDGSVINLSDANAGLVSKQGNVSVGKTPDGKLVYQVKSAENQPLIYNTISTPRGGEYQIVLPDGTKVWLNAASSLRFPSVFSASERNVELTGEAYFEVAKFKNKPFKVNVNKMGIEVLGTHFNVNAYADESSIKTTLLEGSVKLSSGNNQKLLIPGQQASLNSKSGFDIKAVNVEEAVAWKNGYFIFDNENIQDIMRKVARWYDVEVVYQGKIDEGSYGGTVSRFNSVAGVLRSLELTGTVHFKTEGRRITVMP